MLSGSLAQQPARGGHAWVFLQYLLGFRALGLDVLFIDRLTPDMGATEAGRAYIASVMEQFGLEDAYHLIGAGREGIAGIERSAALSRTEGSLLINVNGFLDDEEFLEAAGVRVFLDIDPGFAQMWRELGLHDAFAGHDVFVTIAEKIGRPGCSIPTCGLEWITTRQPVVLDLWPALDGEGRAFTTVGSWRGPSAPIDYNGTTFGLRVHEFRKFMDLPRLAREEFDLALDIDDADVSDLALLERSGWRLLKPEVVAGDPRDYRDFIGRSKAEFMVAKNMYVETRGGWFSDRSVCYLASGRPVLAEDTGLTGLYPIGEGLLVFSTLNEAVACVESVVANHSRHSRAAREIAEVEFGSARVLGELLEQISA